MRIFVFFSILVFAAWFTTTFADNKIAQNPNRSSVAKENSVPIQETVQSGELQFDVSVEPEKKKVTVVPTSEEELTSPPALRMHFFTKEEDSSPIQLKAITPPPDSGPSYAGRLNNWNNSYIGFILQFSFDKKTWKSVRHEFRHDRDPSPKH